jgi:hypothetical protein
VANDPKNDLRQNAGSNDAAEQVADAHKRLSTLRSQIGEHPELLEAIRSLEMALSILTVKTGGML